VGTGRFPPSVGDTIAGNTERYYSPPQYVQSPANLEPLPSFAPPTSDPAPPMNSFFRFMKVAARFFLVVGLIVTTSMAVVFSQQADHARRERGELERQARTRASRENANGRAQNAWDQMEEALILSQEASEKAADAGATLTVSDERPVNLDRFAYPKAETEAKV